MKPKNNMTRNNVAVILAGGNGARMGANLPKQLIKIAGKPIIEHTVEVLQRSKDVDEIIVMISAENMQATKDILNQPKYTKITKFVEGGSTRNETSRLALESIDHKDCCVIFHDAVRPLLSLEIIHNCFEALKDYDAVDVAIPSADTIIEVHDSIIRNIPDRSKLMRGQTPQGFRKSVIEKAYEIAIKDPDFKATDDCGVVLKYLPHVPIKVVEGEDQNMKATHPIDLYILDKLFQLSTTAVDCDRQEELSGKTVVVFGGSQGIGSDIVEAAKILGANVFSFSRKTTNTYVEKNEDVSKALRETYQKTGRIDYVVNTAGLLHIQSLSDMNNETVVNAIEVNYIAPIIVAKASFPYLKKTKGQLLLFTSSSYTRGRAEYSVYSSSKAAVVNLTQALADEWVKDDIRINCINPERTATPMRLKAFGKEDPRSLLCSADVARASINTLLSDITGQVIDVRRKH